MGTDRSVDLGRQETNEGSYLTVSKRFPITPMPFIQPYIWCSGSVEGSFVVRTIFSALGVQKKGPDKPWSIKFG